MQEPESRSRKPIEIPRAKGLTLTRKYGEGVRVFFGEQYVDVTVTQIRGKQVRLTVDPSERASAIHRTWVAEINECT